MKNLRRYSRILIAAICVWLRTDTHGEASVTNSRATNASVATAKPDPWKALRAFVGKWTGEVRGEPGHGTAEREYKFILNNRYLQCAGKSTYPPQGEKKGETHEELGLFSYDRAARKFMLRQFHAEGFVNQYVCESVSEDGQTLIFVTTAIENIPAGWRARETYRFTSSDEFTETFELAEPEKEFTRYSETKFRRQK